MDELIAFVRKWNDADEQWAKDVIACGPGDISGLFGIAERMLREVAAKRFILERATAATPHERGALTTVLRCLALPYDSRPGYQQEWAL